MFEVLVLVAVVVVLAQFNKRLSRLEREVADRHAYPASPWAAPTPDYLETEPHPADGQILAAEAESVGAAEPGPLISHAEAGSSATLDATEPEPVEQSVEDADQTPSSSFSFEELFGRRLPIWAGGITLAVAGMLIVKLSIDAGLLSPPVRVILGMLFGFALIGAAEIALRQEARVRDERVRQALSGAGIASLYASVLVAANLYHLVGALAAMLGMAAVTALALGLSLRFGAPSALLGLAGGLAAPALIGSDEPNVPLLSLYLALAVGGLTTVSRSQRWAWLGISALVGGFGWGLMLMLGGALSMPDTISVALYLLLLGIALPMLGFAGGSGDRLRLIAAIAAAAQMAALVATGGFSLLHWALFGMISLAMLWLAWREPKLQRLPPVGMVIALLLLGAWPNPSIRDFALVAGGAALIYGVSALVRLWREEGGLVEAGQLAAITIGGLFIPMLHFYRSDGSTDFEFGLISLVLAALAATCAAMGWCLAERRDDARFAILATSSALLLAAAASLLLPGWAVGGAMAAVGLGLLHLGQEADDPRLEPISWIFAAAGLAACFATTVADAATDVESALRWGLMATMAAAFAWRARLAPGRTSAQFLAPLLLFLAFEPILPVRVQPLIAPAMLIALASVRTRLMPAMASATLILLLWALVPIGQWSNEVLPSIAAFPVLVTNLPSVEDSWLKLAIPAAALGMASWQARKRLKKREKRTAWWAAGAIGIVALHIFYKQLFAIGSPDQFVEHGLAERTLWQLLLLAGGAALWRIGLRLPALVLGGTAAAHWLLYTLLLHNPLWSAQSVGAWPLINLLPVVYAVPVAVIWALDRIPTIRSQLSERAVAAVWMALILLFAASMLRQLFHGSLLIEPGLSQAEDIARSIMAILAAIGFLLWGIRRQDRDWRIGSLILMLAAVAKVFLWDTQGLEGLTRIASFVALGFSLIGIGWLYSRQLAPART